MFKLLVIAQDPTEVEDVLPRLAEAGMEIEVSKCVIMGLERARETSPDLLLVVEDFPTMTVIDFLELKKLDAKLAEIPVIMLNSSECLKAECYKLGCDDFMLLPADTLELLFRIRSVLRRSRRGGIVGSLDHIGLVDIIQMLLAARSDGRIDIEHGEMLGALYFEGGQIVHATWSDPTADQREKLGESAFYSIIRGTTEGGKFLFTSELQEIPHRSVQRRTDHILLGLANTMDEDSL